MSEIRNVFAFLIFCFICLVVMANWMHSVTRDTQYRMELLHKKYDTLLFERDSLELILDSLPLGHPLDSIKVSEGFGIRRHPITKKWNRHCGLDLSGTYKDTIYATGSGRVIKAKRFRGYGRCVIIKHKGGYKSLYGHMNKVFVKWNDEIKDGQPIGTVGSTGFSTGPHLHYEISRYGKRTDPLVYIIS